MRLNLLTKWGYFKEVKTIIAEPKPTVEGRIMIDFGVIFKQGEDLKTWWFEARHDDIEVLLNAIGNTLSYLGTEPELWEVTINTINNIVTWESEGDIERITLGEILDELANELEEKRETVAEEEVTEGQETEADKAFKSDIANKQMIKTDLMIKAKIKVIKELLRGYSLKEGIENFEQTSCDSRYGNPEELEEEIKKELEEIVKRLEEEKERIDFINYKNKMDEKLARWAKPEGE